MTVTIDLTPEQEEQLASAARRAGLRPDELITRLVAQNLPLAAPKSGEALVNYVRDLLAQWQEQDNTPFPSPIPTKPGETPTQALFRQWAEEDAQMTEEDRESEDRLWAEIEAGI